MSVQPNPTAFSKLRHRFDINVCHVPDPIWNDVGTDALHDL